MPIALQNSYFLKEGQRFLSSLRAGGPCIAPINRDLRDIVELRWLIPFFEPQRHLSACSHRQAKSTPVEYGSLPFGIQRGEAKERLYVRRVKRRTYIVSAKGQSFLCVPCTLWLKKGNKSTKATMCLRSRFIGAMRIEQNRL